MRLGNRLTQHAIRQASSGKAQASNVVWGVLVVSFVVLSLLLVACAPRKSLTIGIVNFSRTLDPTVEGFKEGMAELGYVEGESVTYIYDDQVESITDLDPAIQDLLGKDLDLILSLTTPASSKVKQAFAERDTPVVFPAVTDPVDSGLVDSLTHPGGNLTGIRTGGSIAKGLEWLLAIAPDTRRLFVPHNPEDSGSVQGLAELSEPAAALGLELVIAEVSTSDEFNAAMDAIPEDVDAIFVLPTGFLVPRIAKFVETAIAHKLPLMSVSPQCGAGALVCYGFDYRQMGKQAARLADQILQGAAPGDLPVETAEFFLSLNLQAAQAIGLDIPEDILEQADHIVR
jgi:putative ABC transport system substrate-binding protein